MTFITYNLLARLDEFSSGQSYDEITRYSYSYYEKIDPHQCTFILWNSSRKAKIIPLLFTLFLENYKLYYSTFYFTDNSVSCFI